MYGPQWCHQFLLLQTTYWFILGALDALVYVTALVLLLLDLDALVIF